MTEVLGQRSLLGFGVVLAWLVLFHLMVNIWLLCVFTSLLVVLGGWLGSQVVLESENVVHLERFITLEEVPASVGDDQHLDEEIHNTVRKIIRDFITSWYSTVSSDTSFETEIHDAMLSMAMEMKTRARHVNRKELTQRILDLFGCHLQDYIRSKELLTEQQTSMSCESEQLWRAYSRVTTPHLAMTSDAAELNYTRAFVDLLLHVLVPSPHLESQTGRFVVGELITCNVFLPLIAKLSDPDWLNMLMIEIFGKAGTLQEPVRETVTASPQLLLPPTAESELAPPLETSQAPQKNTEAPLARAETHTVPAETEMTELTVYDVFDGEEVDCPQNNAEEEEGTPPFLECYIRGSKSNPFYQENDSDLDSPLADYKQSSNDSLVMIGQEESLYDRRKECTTSVKNNNDVDLDDVCHSAVGGSCPNILVNLEHPNGYSLLSSRAAEGTLSVSSLQDLERDASSSSGNLSRDLPLGVDQTGFGNPSELTAGSPLQVPSPMPSFSFEPLSSPDGPVIIQNLRITGTITAKEHRGTGSHPYTLYTIKYETAMGCENQESIQPGSEDAEALQTSSENPSRIQPVAYHMVNRRYSEFLNLQTRLEEKSELRKLIKGVKGPKKIFPDMPFGNMDSDKIEARRGLLETFLKQLCAIPEIANSEEMQEFLALNTDARIAFVKKPFIVSRIDKIVDTLKTAFPRSELQSPTEDNETETDGMKIGFDKKSKSRLKFSSKNILPMNGSDIRPPVLFSLEQRSTVFNRMSLEDLEVFITEQEKLSIRAVLEREESPLVGEFMGYQDDGSREKRSQGHASETALAEVALNILCLLMKEQWSWLCTENIQRTIRLLFGTLIDRWLDVGVANLMSKRYWVLYLQVIQESVWPGGTLPTSPRLERSQQQKDITRQQALHCLMRLLPDLVSDMLGSDKYKICWQTALDSLQNPYINRHLVYSLFDVLLEFLVPELPEEDFQWRLLQTLSKNPEKTLA
ncbi:sorting nexin-19 [Solea solea]|uniref:sorting nexin-19 n=1 Tax=Solea solea TaxID=90069 RepID=UPI00272C7F25|nr:sorting nexin-19 [Solea solea]XP_058490314.1 sorting nexin-19 [Solea solea]